MILMTQRRFERWLKQYYERGVTKGFELGYAMGQVEGRGRELIGFDPIAHLGGLLKQQVGEILDKKEV